MAVFVVHLPASVSASRDARAFLRASLATEKLDGFGEVTELLTSELVTNAVVHAASPAIVRVVVEGARLRVEVDDASIEPAVVVRSSDLEQGSGRGLLLVEELATRWGSDIRPDGKTVWFELDGAPATREVHGVSG